MSAHPDGVGPLVAYSVEPIDDGGGEGGDGMSWHCLDNGHRVTIVDGKAVDYQVERRPGHDGFNENNLDLQDKRVYDEKSGGVY